MNSITINQFSEEIVWVRSSVIVTNITFSLVHTEEIVWQKIKAPVLVVWKQVRKIAKPVWDSSVGTASWIVDKLINTEPLTDMENAVAAIAGVSLFVLAFAINRWA